MSKEEFELKKEILESISAGDVKNPNMPIDVALQEAEDLLVWCVSDEDKLTKGGLDWALVDDLPVCIGACRYIQSQWRKEYRSIKEAQKEWGQKSPAAFKLRKELLHHFKHAFFKRPDLLAKVKKIAEGNSNADMIQDLSDLAVLGNDNKDLLTNTLMELSMLDKAAATSDSLSVVLANANGERLKNNATKLTRDRAYAHMKVSVDEIRRCGHYVFWRDEFRMKGYTSRYYRLRNQSRSKNKQSKADTEG